jgi:hypothetical protein
MDNILNEYFYYPLIKLLKETNDKKQKFDTVKKESSEKTKIPN